MESIGGLKNKSTSSTIQSNAQSRGKLIIKSKIIDGVVAAVSIQANDNTTINQNLILPESSGNKNETLRIKNDVTNNNEELEWYRVPEDSYSDLSNDRDVEFDVDVYNLSLNNGLSFDTDGGDFSNLINNKIGEDNNTAQYVRFNVSSNPPIYPQSFTYTPDPTNDHSLRKVQMWIRKYGSGTETDKTMFPSKFEIHGIPRGGSSSDSVLITTINSPEVNNMNYSASTEYGLNNPVIDESFNPDGLIYDSYEFKIYGNRVDTNNDNYYKPVIGEIKLFGRKVIRNFTNNSIYQLQGISKFETLNVKVVLSSESVNKGDVYKTDLNTSITATNYYIINDITTPNLKFRTGQIYIFNQDDSSNDGHPITFYTDRAKNTEYTNTDNIKYIINDDEHNTSSLYSNNFGTNRYRRVKILITDDMPGRLYYQCINHLNMGGVIETGTVASSGGATQINDLSDVDTTITPLDGKALIYDNSISKWIPSTVYNTVLQNSPLVLTASGLVNSGQNNIIINGTTFLHDNSLTNHGQFANIIQYPSNSGFIIDTNTQEITIPRKGVYEIMISFSVKNTTSRFIALSIYINGVNVTGSNTQNSDSVDAAGDDYSQHKTIETIDVNTGDIIKFSYVTANSSTVEPSSFKLILKQIDVLPVDTGILKFSGLSSDKSVTSTESKISNMTNEFQNVSNYYNIDANQDITFNYSGIYEIMISYSTLDDTTPNIYVILKLDGTTIYQSPYEGQYGSTVNSSSYDYDMNKTIDLINANSGQKLEIFYKSDSTVGIDKRLFKLILKKITNTDDYINRVNLQDLYNVSTTTPSNGQALVWNDSDNEWKPGSVVSIVTSQPSSQDPDGTLKYDTNNSKLYLRVGNEWVAFSKD